MVTPLVLVHLLKLEFSNSLLAKLLLSGKSFFVSSKIGTMRI